MNKKIQYPDVVSNPGTFQHRRHRFIENETIKENYEL